MKLVILGANGRTGRLVARAALKDGMDVTAVVRHDSRTLDLAHERLRRVVGDPCDITFLSSVLHGQDAVISTLGSRSPTKTATSVYDRSAEALVHAAANTGLKRILVTSTALLFPGQPFVGRILRWLVPNVVTRASRMEAILKASDLDWTAARVGFLTNDGETAFRAHHNAAPANGTSVSRHALANFLVSAVKTPDTWRGVYGVARADGPKR